ncbi:MAG: 3-hydroxyacyl-ACP dehydratase FabZ [Myxococcales bacterium]|nr:3-hydroxyacyl-ACP dehydratase FabZ [Myxococcales bacterium]
MRPVIEVLPHRPPFLFLDEVLQMDERTIVARRVVRGDEPQFEGHYPGRPIMPGVLLCETVVQAGAYLMATLMGEDAKMKGAPVVARLNNVKFKQMVTPGDDLEVHAEHLRSRAGAHMMKGHILVKNTMVCSLEFTVMLVDDESTE